MIDSDIPLLLSKKEMQKHGMIIFLMEDKAEVQGTKVSLKITSAGHFNFPLLNQECLLVDEVFAINLQKAPMMRKSLL